METFALTCRQPVCYCISHNLSHYLGCSLGHKLSPTIGRCAPEGEEAPPTKARCLATSICVRETHDYSKKCLIGQTLAPQHTAIDRA
jgi:hypothetical protein